VFALSLRRREMDNPFHAFVKYRWYTKLFIAYFIVFALFIAFWAVTIIEPC
jgi:hypothetical protein